MLWLAKALCSGGHSTFPALAKPSQGFATRLGKLGKLPEKVDLPDVKAAVAIASGKGGVGKSTTTANVAVALAKNPGFKIGILDADVFGPSQPRLFGLKGRPQPSAAQKMIPLQNHGVHVMSMGFLLEAGQDARPTDPRLHGSQGICSAEGSALLYNPDEEHQKALVSGVYHS
ncbi:hypothetical protein WJX84_005135 [Apatococcus fuscideae]|uniref:NUBPL n=1 Tax=Apatococcus fuscideae TaxID=2026836 RepID=A0AAW1SQV5_9CHLO